MKNLKSEKILLIILATIFCSVIACERIEPKKLSNPQVRIFSDRIEWDMNTCATGYEIVTDQTITATNTVFYFGNYKGKIKVKCLGDGKLYSDSDYAVVEI